MANNHIADMRISYERAALDRNDLHNDPFVQFQRWFDIAREGGILEPNAMTLATASADGMPSARIVLLKGIDSGFRFFTNYESHKGQDIAGNPRAAIVFYWDILHKQVRIEGQIEKLTAAESAEYYHSRPRGSQIGAWSSPQSTVIPDRAFLEAREQSHAEQFADSDPIPLPPFWGGYRLVPTMIEFWQGRKSRLHDRFKYTRASITSPWQITRHAP